MAGEENGPETAEYARWIGLDPEKEPELMWIAREGLVAPIPENWKLCKSENGEVYYHNEKTGEKSWDHPSDAYYRKLGETERAKLKGTGGSTGGDTSSAPAPTASSAPASDSNPPPNSPYNELPPPPPVESKDPAPTSSAPPPPPPASNTNTNNNSNNNYSNNTNSQDRRARDSRDNYGSESHRDQRERRELWSDFEDPRPVQRTASGTIRRGDSFLDSDDDDAVPGRYSSRPYTPRSGSPHGEYPHRVSRPSNYAHRAPMHSRGARYRTDSEGEFSYFEDESGDDEPSEPTPREIRQYALYLGMKFPDDEDLLWIAREGLIEPLPKAWRQRRRRDGAVYFFNTETRETAWEHPVDDKYRRLYKTIRRKQRGGGGSSSSRGGGRSRSRGASSRVPRVDEYSDDEGYFRPDSAAASYRGLDQRVVDSSRTRSPNRMRMVSRVPSASSRAPSASSRGPRYSRKPDYVYDIEEMPRSRSGGVPLEEEHDVLHEYVDPNYKPTTREVREYAKHLGFDVERDKRYFWIAQQGLRTPLGPEWKPCRSSSGHVYYFNFDKGESVWEHPVDTMCKQKYAEEKQKERLKSWSAPLQYNEEQQSFLYETQARFSKRPPERWAAYPHPRHLPNSNPRRNGEQAWSNAKPVPNENQRSGHHSRSKRSKRLNQQFEYPDDSEDQYNQDPNHWYRTPFKYDWQVDRERQAPLRDVSSGHNPVDRSRRAERDNSRRRISRRGRSASPPPSRAVRRERSRSPVRSRRGGPPSPRGPPIPIRTVEPPPRVVHVYDGPPQTAVPTRVNPVLRSVSANQTVSTTPYHPTNRPGPSPIATTQRYDHPRQMWSGASNWQSKR